MTVRMAIYGLFIFMICSFFACQKLDADGNINNVNERDSTLLKALVWFTPLSKDTFNTDAFQIIYEEGRIYVAYGRSGRQIICLDAHTGDEIWEWYSNSVNGTPADFELGEGTLVINFRTGIAGIDALTGKSKWERPLGNQQANQGLKIIGNQAYFSRDIGFIPFHDAAILNRINIHNGKVEEFWKLDKGKLDGFSPTIHELEFWEHPEGDTIALYYVSGINIDLPGENKLQFYAFNLSKDSLYFKFDNIDPYAVSYFKSPVVYENLAFFNGPKNTYCYDLEKKELKWTAAWPGYESSGLGGNQSTKPIIVWPNVIVKPDSEELYCFEASDRKLIWKTANTAYYSSEEMKEYFDIVYFTSFGDKRLHAIEVQTGKTIWRSESLFKTFYDCAKCNFKDENVAINKEEGLIYVHDNIYVMCFKAIE